MRTHKADGPAAAAVVDLYARLPDDPPPTVWVGLHRTGRWTIVEVEGEMDVQVIPLVSDVGGGNASHVVFELHGVTFMDACGLGVLMESRRRAVEAGGCVRLAAPSRSTRRLLSLTGSGAAFGTYDSLDEAVSAPVLVGPSSVA